MKFDKCKVRLAREIICLQLNISRYAFIRINLASNHIIMFHRDNLSVWKLHCKTRKKTKRKKHLAKLWYSS